MDDLREQVELLESSANLSTSIVDVQKAIDLLTAARAKIAAGTCACYAHSLTQLANGHMRRCTKGAFDPRKVAGPLQEDAGCSAKGSEADICWSWQVWQDPGQGTLNPMRLLVGD
jgi:hypothetical protein